MKVKTENLIGPALDWAVIVAEHGQHDVNNPRHVEHFKNIRGGHTLHQQAHYSTNWAHGGPIIEREHLELSYLPSMGEQDRWKSLHTPDDQDPYFYYQAYGATPLIAAMRCFVASKLGDEVDVPDSLVSKGSGTDQEAA